MSLTPDGNTVAIGAFEYNDSASGYTRVFKWDPVNERWNQKIEQPLVATVCFPKGTPVQTDQGIVDIDLIDPEVHTMNGGDRIVAVTQTVGYEPDVIKISKGSIGNTSDTVISNNHKIMLDGKSIKARDLVGKYQGVTKVPYKKGDYLYNILLEYHGGMFVNGMLVETLDPTDVVAQLYNLNIKERIECTKVLNTIYPIVVAL